MVDVEQWAEIRRMHKVQGLSIREIARRTGRDRNTVRAALRSAGPPRYRRGPRPSKLDPFKARIHELLEDDAQLPGKRIREEIEEDGYAGSKTILDDYLREARPRFQPPRTYQRTSYRPAGDLPVRRLAAEAGDPRRQRPDPPGLRRHLRPRVVSRRRLDSRLLQAGPRPALRHRPLPGLPRRPAEDDRLGPRGRPSRRRRPADLRVRRLLR